MRSVPESIPYPKQPLSQPYQQPVPVFTDTDNFNSNYNIHSLNTSGHKVKNHERKEYIGPKITPTKVRDLGNEVFEV